MSVLLLARQPSAAAAIRNRCSAVAARIRCKSGLSIHPNKKSSKSSSLATPGDTVKWNQLSTPQKVVAVSKVSFNLGFILLGAGLTAGLAYYVGSELFSADSPPNIMENAVKHIQAHSGVTERLGAPITGHSRPRNNRGRHNHRVMYQIAQDTKGNEVMVMQFYLDGASQDGTARAILKKDEKGHWQFEELFVDVPGQGYPSQRYFVIDSKTQQQ
ncbi:hypothetical protein VTP01DRAFT_5544 [Rhizomucor pusillus]|uniref:uncharacterized protein n=1 Tax=Rhizomucor pusillus TaxID=4840 RepID=UPI003743E548